MISTLFEIFICSWKQSLTGAAKKFHHLDRLLVLVLVLVCTCTCTYIQAALCPRTKVYVVVYVIFTVNLKNPDPTL